MGRLCFMLHMRYTVINEMSKLIKTSYEDHVMQYYFVFFALIFYILSPISIQSNEWLKESFPNPLRDTKTCGRRGVVSWICDPDEIISYEDANILEEMLQSISLKTKSGCSIDSQRPGYQVGVAVMKKMAMPSEMSREEVAQDFARHLHNEWGVGSSGCDDGVLLLLSVTDRQIYVSTGRTAKVPLSDDQIAIIMDEMKLLLHEHQYGKALHVAVKNMQQVFAGKVLGTSNSLKLLVLLGVLGVFLCNLVYIVYNNKQQKEQYENCQEKLKRIEMERKAAKESKKYVSSSCPICLEEFSPEIRTRLLMCGHKYCEPCLIKWLETNSTCPICHQSTNKENKDKDSAASQSIDFFPELAFRLLCLQRQYPTFISQDMVHHWTSQQYQESFVQDPMFTRVRPSLSSSTVGSAGSSGRFGGGGCSGGGGRGDSW